MAQVEGLRYRQRVELLERELQELQDSLNAEREKVQVCILSFKKALVKSRDELISVSNNIKFSLK